MTRPFSLYKFSQKKGLLGDVLVGASLGPVFSSCSPTYALIVATILPQSFVTGLVNIIVYAVGLGIMLLLISIYGQKIVSRLNLLSDPNGKFKKVLGILFVVLGILIMFGWEKDIETYLIKEGIFDTSNLETKFFGKGGFCFYP